MQAVLDAVINDDADNAIITRRDSLAQFVDNLGEQWFYFLETKIGSFTIPREEVPQGDNNAGIFLSRAIRLPNEKQ
ncbi:hypothetical protein CDEN61S_03861 [Castellaniella denitrificans]